MLQSLRKKLLRFMISRSHRLVKSIVNSGVEPGTISRNTRDLLGIAEDHISLAVVLFDKMSEETDSACRDEILSFARSLLVRQIPNEAWFLIPSLEKRSVPILNSWAFQNEVMEWDISDNDLVLDIGFGGYPFKRADHLADKYLSNTTHRAEKLRLDERPFVNLDIEKLPFRDQSYDFVFCSHVLEHLDNPGIAIRELMRVSSSGYIEVPTRLSDIMFNFTRLPDHHRWHGLTLGNKLILMEWNDWERRNLENHYFSALFSDYENNFQTFFEANRDLFFASYHWTKKIEFMLIDKQGNLVDSTQ